MENIVKHGGGELSPYNPDFAKNISTSGDMPHLFAPVLRHPRLAITTALVLAIVGCPAIYFFVKMNSSYVTTAAVRVVPTVTSVLTNSRDSGEMINYTTFMNTQASMVTMPTVLQRAADELQHKDLAIFKGKTDIAEALHDWAMEKTISASPASKTELILITMKSDFPSDAERIVDAIVRAYMSLEMENVLRGGNEKLQILEDERKQLAGNIEAYRSNIRNLAKEYGTVSLTERQESLLQQVKTFQSELTRIQTQRIALEAQIQLLSDSNHINLAGLKPSLREEYINSDIAIQALTQNLAQLEQNYELARTILAPANPELARKAELIEALKARLEQKRAVRAKGYEKLLAEQSALSSRIEAATARAQLAQLTTHENKIKQVLSEQNKYTIEMGRKQLTIQDMQDQLAQAKQMHEMIGRRIQELEMEQKRPARVNLAYSATSDLPKSKLPKFGAIMLLFSIGAGFLAALLKDRSDRSVHTPDDVTRRIGIRVLGTTTSPGEMETTFLSKRIADDYHSIRANLKLISGEGIPGRLVITSPCARDGKTVFSINLATSLAKSGKRVLLVDGDLRKPELARIFKFGPDTKFLQDVLLAGPYIAAVASSPVEGLDILPSDNRNASNAPDVLSSSAADELISELSGDYDHIIIDTPPVLAAPDALLWAKLADAVLLTGFSGRTSDRDLREASQRLEDFGIKVLGMVLNSVPATNCYYPYGYQYGPEHVHNQTRKHAKELVLALQENSSKS